MTPVEAVASPSLNSTAPAAPRDPATARLSYKFQRLRERLRKAVETGELAGKLPGERELAKRFNANPKTLSKALTDLAAEGLLDRSIGRGTYVKGAAPAASVENQKWLLLAKPAQSPGEPSESLLAELLRLHPDAEVARDSAGLRPSFLNQFQAVIDLSPDTPESFHRALLVRGLPTLLINREPGPFKVPAILFDRAHAALQLARNLFFAGHRRIIILEETDTLVSDTVRLAAQRYAPDAAITASPRSGVARLANEPDAAFLCDGQHCANALRELLDTHPHLQSASIASLGITTDTPAFTGIHLSAADLATAAADFMKDLQLHRPAILWLTGAFTDHQSLHPLAEHLEPAAGAA